MKFYTASDARSNPDGQLTVHNRTGKIFERVKKRHGKILTQMMKSNSVRAAWRWDSILYVVMIICVFRALDSFFMLHDTKAAIEKFSLMENGFKEEKEPYKSRFSDG